MPSDSERRPTAGIRRRSPAYRRPASSCQWMPAPATGCVTLEHFSSDSGFRARARPCRRRARRGRLGTVTVGQRRRLGPQMLPEAVSISPAGRGFAWEISLFLMCVSQRTVAQVRAECSFRQTRHREGATPSLCPGLQNSDPLVRAEFGGRGCSEFGGRGHAQVVTGGMLTVADINPIPVTAAI